MDLVSEHLQRLVCSDQSETTTTDEDAETAQRTKVRMREIHTSSLSPEEQFLARHLSVLQQRQHGTDDKNVTSATFDLLFDFVDNIDDVKTFVSDHQSLDDVNQDGQKKILDEQLRTSVNLAEILDEQLRISVNLADQHNTRDVITAMTSSWTKRVVSGHLTGTMEVKPHREVLHSDTESPHVAKLDAVRIEGGGMSRPSVFTHHWALPVDVNMSTCFEHDNNKLTISITGDGATDFMDVDYKSIKEKIVVSYNVTKWRMYIHIKHAPRLTRLYSRDHNFRPSYLREKEDCPPLRIERLTSFGNLASDSIGNTSVLCLTVTGGPDVTGPLLMRLRQKGFRIVFTGVTNKVYTDIGLGKITFPAPDLSFAWESLISSDCNVTDAITERFVRALKKDEHRLHPDHFYLLRSISIVNQFFDFEKELEEVLLCKQFSSCGKLPLHHVMLGEVIITPTRKIVTPMLLTPCNTLTQAHQSGDAEWLRVRFCDEDTCPMSVPERTDQGQIQARIRTFLDEPLTVAGMEYALIAASLDEGSQPCLWYHLSQSDQTVDALRKRLGIKKNQTQEGYIAVTDAVDCIGILDDAENRYGSQFKVSEHHDQSVMGTMSKSTASKIAVDIGLREVPPILELVHGGLRMAVHLDPELSDTDVINITTQEAVTHAGSLCVVDCSKPEPVRLSAEMIVLLSDMGIPDSVFLEMQQRTIFSAAAQLLQNDENTGTWPLQDPGNGGEKATEDSFIRSTQKMQFDRKLEKMKGNLSLEIAPDKGRSMYGVALSYPDLLQDGQVFISYTGTESGAVRIIMGKVLVMQTPCLGYENVKVFEAVDVPEYRHMKNCIVFPKLKTSVSSSYFGKLAVCWDDKLVPSNYNNTDGTNFPGYQCHPKLYIGVDDLTFRMKNDHVDQVRRMFLTHADLKNVRDPKCQRLALLYRSITRSNEIFSTPEQDDEVNCLHTDWYPDFIARRNEACYASTKIAGQLYRIVAKLLAAIKQTGVRTLDNTFPLTEIYLHHGYKQYKKSAELARQKFNTRIMYLMLTNQMQDEVTLIVETQNSSGRSTAVTAQYKRAQEEIKDYFFSEFEGTEVQREDGVYADAILAKASAWCLGTYNNGIDVPFAACSFPYMICKMIEKQRGFTKNEFTAPLQNAIACIGEAIVFQQSQKELERERAYIAICCIADDAGDRITKQEQRDVTLVGLASACLMDDRKHVVELCIQNGQKWETNMLKKAFPEHEESDDSEILFKVDGYNIHLKFSQNRMLDNRTAYIQKHTKCHPNDVVVLQFLLDWARSKHLIGKTGKPLFEDTVFVLIAIEILRKNRKMAPDQSSNPLKQNIHNEWSPIKNVAYDETASSVMGVLHTIAEMLRPNENGIVIIEMKDPTNPHRRLVSRDLDVSDCEEFVHQVLVVYCTLAMNRLIVLEHQKGGPDPCESTYLLPANLWESVYVSPSSTARSLRKESGAAITIRDSSFDGIPGHVMEVRGTTYQLARLDRTFQSTCQRALYFEGMSTTSYDIPIRDNAYKLIFEGARDDNEKLSIQPYNGRHHYQHASTKRGKPVLCEKHSDSSDDLDLFEEDFQEQMRLIQKDYDPDTQGSLCLLITFGTFYLIHPSLHETLTIRDLREQIHRPNRGQGHDRTPRQRSAGRRGGIGGRSNARARGFGRAGFSDNNNWRGRNDGGSGNWRNSYGRPFRGGGGDRYTRRMARSFIPMECNMRKVRAFLKQSCFKLNSTSQKYNVNYGETSYHSTVVLDADLRLKGSHPPDLKWFVADIVSRSKSSTETSLDVRCKVISRQPTAAKRYETNTILATDARILIKQGDSIAVHPDFKNTIKFARLKITSRYTFDGPRADKSLWHDVLVHVSTVTEYSDVDPESGMFRMIQKQEEVTVLPKLPAVQRPDIDWGEYARRIWDLITQFSEQFDL